MEKIAIIYSSKFGHTKKYADWLKEDLGADVLSIDGFSITKLISYKLIIFACGVYGDKLSVIDFIKKNMASIPLQKTMIMAVSWYTNDSVEAKQKLIDENYPEQLKNVVPLYVVNSGIDLKKVPAMDKAKLLTARLMIEKKEGRSSDDINALAIIKGYSDQTSKDNLASIKKGIDEFFNPPKKEEPKPAPKAEPKPVPKAESKPAPKATPAPAPAASDDISQSVDDAFNNLSFPKKKPQAESSGSDELSQSVDEAFKNLYAPKPKPAPQPVSEEPQAAPEEKKIVVEEPVVRFNSSGQVVVSSVLDAINSLNHAQDIPAYATQQPKPEAQAAAPAPKPQPEVQAAAPAPKPQPEVQAAAPAPKPQPEVQAATPAPKPQPEVQAAAPAPKPQPEIQEQPAQPKNSYMELFANRRRKASADESASAAVPAGSAVVEPTPAPSAPAAPAPEPDIQVSVGSTAVSEPSASEMSLDGFDIAEAALSLHTTPPPVKNAVPAPSIDIDEMDSYDFIGEESASASKRALNAVQDLAKAKAKAEEEKKKEAARKSASTINQDALNQALAAAQQAAEQEAEQEASYGSAYNSDESASAFEKMKRDMEALAEESEHGIEYDNSEQEEFSMPMEPEAESEDDGLAAFSFADTADYYNSQPVTTVEIEPEEPVSREKTDLDLRKLQEEINASIETNRASRERMKEKYSKKHQEVVNPFAVQFDEEEDDKKKGKKSKKQAEPKRLADPIDPDIFFNKPGKDYFTASDTMPELKIRK